MPGPKPEFDAYSDSYENMLRDPLRDVFSSGTEFFQARKYYLIRDYLRRNRIDGRQLSYLDLGCGKGELASRLRADFGRVAGCDPSVGMLPVEPSFETRVQQDPGRIPFGDAEFDFVTAVCVYHHVPVAARPALTREVARVLRPGGVFCVIEHNPFNPVTRLVVRRSPVDLGAVLLRPSEVRALQSGAGLSVHGQRYFLYLPQQLYKRFGILETVLAGAPFGGQYAVFGRAPGLNELIAGERSAPERPR